MVRGAEPVAAQSLSAAFGGSALIALPIALAHTGAVGGDLPPDKHCVWMHEVVVALCVNVKFYRAFYSKGRCEGTPGCHCSDCSANCFRYYRDLG